METICLYRYLALPVITLSAIGFTEVPASPISNVVISTHPTEGDSVLMTQKPTLPALFDIGDGERTQNINKTTDDYVNLDPLPVPSGISDQDVCPACVSLGIYTVAIIAMLLVIVMFVRSMQMLKQRAYRHKDMNNDPEIIVDLLPTNGPYKRSISF